MYKCSQLTYISNCGWVACVCSIDTMHDLSHVASCHMS